MILLEVTASLAAAGQVAGSCRAPRSGHGRRLGVCGQLTCSSAQRGPSDSRARQWRSLEFDPSHARRPGSGTEVIPGEHSDTSTKPLTHAVAPERTIASVGEWPLHAAVTNQRRLFKLAPGTFCACFYNHAHRLRLDKLLYVELSRSSNGHFKPLPDPDGGFTSETAGRRFRK